MYNLAVNIGLIWYKIFDGNGSLYSSLKTINRMLRFLFYISLFVFTYISLSVINNYINFASFDISSITVDIFYHLWDIAQNGILIGVGLLVSYELIYDLDVKSILAAQKQKAMKIKVAKKEWGRLHNMNFFVRIIFWFVVWFIGLQIIYQQILSFFINNSPYPLKLIDGRLYIEFSDQVAQEAFTMLFDQIINSWVMWYSIFFLIIMMIIEHNLKGDKNV